MNKEILEQLIVATEKNHIKDINYENKTYVILPLLVGRDINNIYILKAFVYHIRTDKNGFTLKPFFYREIKEGIKDISIFQIDKIAHMPDSFIENGEHDIPKSFLDADILEVLAYNEEKE